MTGENFKWLKKKGSRHNSDGYLNNFRKKKTMK